MQTPLPPKHYVVTMISAPHQIFTTTYKIHEPSKQKVGCPAPTHQISVFDSTHTKLIKIKTITKLNCYTELLPCPNFKYGI